MQTTAETQVNYVKFNCDGCGRRISEKGVITTRHVWCPECVMIKCHEAQQAEKVQRPGNCNKCGRTIISNVVGGKYLCRECSGAIPAFLPKATQNVSNNEIDSRIDAMLGRYDGQINVMRKALKRVFAALRDKVGDKLLPVVSAEPSPEHFFCQLTFPKRPGNVRAVILISLADSYDDGTISKVPYRWLNENHDVVIKVLSEKDRAFLSGHIDSATVMSQAPVFPDWFLQLVSSGEPETAEPK